MLGARGSGLLFWSLMVVGAFGSGCGGTVPSEAGAPPAVGGPLSGVGAASQEAAVVQWFAENGVPSDGLHAPLSEEEAAALTGLIGDAPVVSLGEASHGNKEVYLWKNRVIRHLVEHSGMRWVLFEVNLTNARAVNAYVLGEVSDVRQALASLTVSGAGGIYDTEEVLALIEWMRSYNARNDEKVRFGGFDMQDPAAAAGALMPYLNQVAPDLLTALENPPPTSNPLDSMRQALAAMNTLIHKLEAGRQTYVASWPGGADSGAFAFDRAMEDAIQLSQYFELTLAMGQVQSKEDAIRAGDLRDRFMAENALRTLDGSKGVLWLHNGHAITAGSDSSFFPMGRRLKEKLGQSLVTVATVLGEGEVRTRPSPGEAFRALPLPAPNEGTLDHQMAAAARKRGHPAALYVSLAAGRMPNDVRAFFTADRSVRSIGAYWDETTENVVTTRWMDAADALVYFPRVSSAVPLR